MQAQGSSWNLGGPVISTRDAGWGNPVTNPWPIVDCVRSIMGAKKRAPGVVSEVEGNEDQGEGWQGVGAFHITVELGEPAPGDPGEGRGRRIMEPLEGKMAGTSSPENVSTKLQRVAKLSREAPDMIWTTLAHLIDVEFLSEAYRLTRKSGAVGVDGRTAQDYAENLEDNLENLLALFKSGSYKAPPVRRVHIPKGDGEQTRPIGIPTFEDKVLQRAVAMVLESVYEQDFLDCSFGFRPGRSAHQALEYLRNGLWNMHGGHVLEVDLRSFFDTLDHGQLRKILDKRVRDGVIRRAIDKWLKAGVLEEGVVVRNDIGTPQGGVISPLLSNIFLNEVLDRWFESVVRPRLRGRGLLVRYADDFVLAFSRLDDVDRVLDVLPKRMGRFGLKLHPNKTRLVNFKHPAWRGCGRNDKHSGKLDSFDLLGFTHFWAKSFKTGKWIIKRKTARKRLSQALKGISVWCRFKRHLPLPEQHRHLSLKLMGHYQYYGIPGNGQGLNRFYQVVRRTWFKWLNRRSDRRDLTWERYVLILQRFPLPLPKLVHSNVKAQLARDTRSRMQ